MKKAKMKNRGVGVGMKLLLYFSLFTALVLLVIWLFQIYLLREFYEKAKLSELYKTADGIEENVTSDSLDTVVYRYSMDYNLCVLVYKIENAKSEILVSSHTLSGCIIHRLTPDGMSDYYSSVKQNGGEMLKRYIMRGNNYFLGTDGATIVGEKDSSKPGDDGNETIDNIFKKSENIIKTVYMRVFSEDDGTEYFILLSSEMTPLSATVNTLKNQFIWIVIILLVNAVILSFIVSKQITKPLTSMNISARMLAAGNYKTKFVGKGCRETRELADTLNYAATELIKTDNLQKELIANISHDLRTPLTMIKGYGEVMRDIPGENTPENMQVIIDETTRLSALVSDLLDLSKLQAGTKSFHPEILNLTETVEEVLGRYNKLTEKDGYTIKFNADETIYISADRTMLLQVIYNLVNNAINYCGDDKTVKVTQSINGNIVRISVEDHGSGIAPEELPLIWNRYYKVDKVHKRAAVGSGLGLSIVKGALDTHGANYGVDSKLGEGSVFWFEFPRIDNA